MERPRFELSGANALGSNWIASAEDSDVEPSGHATRRRKPPESKASELEETEAADLAADAGDLQAYGRGKRRVGPGECTDSKPEEGSRAVQEQRTREADAIWDQMKDADQSRPETLSLAPVEPAKVRVKRTYRFAGQTVEEEVEMPEDHPEAVAQLKQNLPPSSSGEAQGATGGVTTSTSSIPSASGKAPRPLGGPRKRKAGSLASMAAAAKAKPTKLNTVEKSKMDWEAYKSRSASQLGGSASTGLSRAEVEEMEAQTKGGARGLGNMQGYLDRSDFLARVHARQEEELGRK